MRGAAAPGQDRHPFVGVDFDDAGDVPVRFRHDDADGLNLVMGGVRRVAPTAGRIEHHFAFDLAVSPKAAKIKGVDSPVAGRADIVVVPNIEMGNGLFKMMVYFMSGLAAGVVMGAGVPIVLTSRADPPEARFAATLIAAIIADRAGTETAV